MKCPNRRSKEWVNLIKAIGSETQAMYAYTANGEEIPSIKQAKDILSGLITKEQLIKEQEYKYKLRNPNTGIAYIKSYNKAKIKASEVNEKLKDQPYKAEITKIQYGDQGAKKVGWGVHIVSTEYVERELPPLEKDEVFYDDPQLMEQESRFDSINDIQYQNNTNQSDKDYIASEKTIRDLAERIADRIGLKVKYVSDRTLDYKGKLEGDTAVINLAYATLDTPIHEILGHPIIRAIKNSKAGFDFIANNKEALELGHITQEEYDENIKSQESQLYQNLLKELETGRGKEILDRVKRDYQYKEIYSHEYNWNDAYFKSSPIGNRVSTQVNADGSTIETIKTGESSVSIGGKEINKITKVPYTIEEQQEEAIVELLGLYTADRLDKVKDRKLISLLKRLLKEMKAYMRSLFNQKEVEIDKLPDNMTLGDIADLLAYSNSKLILPGNEVVYTTPDNQTFKTYQEASKHISRLIKSGEEVDLDSININYKDLLKSIPNNINEFYYDGEFGEFGEINLTLKVERREDGWYSESPNQAGFIKITDRHAYQLYTQDKSKGIDNIKDFISKNKEYEQSKEIIEEWKSVNNIQYDPEEVYSRGQGFYSVVGAYSDFDVELMFQNLLAHIEDNKKAGGEFTISAFTKPVDKNLGHLEGRGGKIKFKIFPKSEDIKWAANTDVYSGSVWDAGEKVSKDKKSELIGVSYTKSPALDNIDSVQPNLASIIDNLAHHHNELGIELTGENFRLEYDDNVPYSTKKLIDNINSILDEKFDKLVEPKIKKNTKVDKFTVSEFESNGKKVVLEEFDTIQEAKKFVELQSEENGLPESFWEILDIKQPSGKQPTQTKENTVSINKVKYDLNGPIVTDPSDLDDLKEDWEDGKITQEQYDILTGKLNKKEYTSQALINAKIAALKKANKKYPRSLIRSEIIKSNNNSEDSSFYQKISKETEEIFFQKVSYEGSEASKASTEGSKKKLSGIEKSMKEIMTKIQRRIDILNLSDNTKLAAKQELVLTKMEDAYKKGEYLQGLHSFLENANESFENLNSALEVALSKKPNEQSDEEFSNSANVLNRMGAFISSNKVIIEHISEILNETKYPTDELKKLGDTVKSEFGVLNTNIKLLESTYKKEIILESAKFLKPFGWNTSIKHLEEILENPATDISFTQQFFDAMNVAGDEALRLIAKSVEDTKELARLETLEIQQDLVNLKKKLEKAGIEDTEFMVGRNSKGVQSGNFVVERDWDSFEENRYEFYKKLRDKYKVKNKEEAKEKFESKKWTKKKYDNYLEEISDFYYNNTLSDVDTNKLLLKKERELGTEEYNKWLKLNTKFKEEETIKGRQYMIPINENPRYKEIMSNPLKKEYYNKVINLKLEMEKTFPEKFKNSRLMPQIRRDSIERIKKGDIKGLVNDIQESYKVMEDEDSRGNYGLTDERDNVVHFLPIYFTKRLKETKHLSTDITSTMVSFINMANDRRHMLKITDNIDLLKDVIKDRKTLKGVKTWRTFLGEKEQIDVTSGETSRAFKRLLEYIDMTVYGIKETPTVILGKDVSKVIDSFAGYTALVQLGMNIYAGINNVNVGAAMLRTEAAAKEFFSPKDLFWADSIYAKELPKTLGDVGARIQNNKLGLWLLKHDTMENYSETIASLDAERKTRFSQLFNMSSFFFMSRAGEHYIHSKGSLALANNFRYDKESKRFIMLKDFYEPLEDLKKELQYELSILPSKGYKNASKEIKAKYDPKIKELKDKLDSRWKEMTNYWDAHEVKDSNLVLKEEFKSDNWKEDHLRFKNLQNSINRSLHGNYGPFAAAIQKYALGRLAMMFHKWIKPYWNRRYQKVQKDFNRHTDNEGFYLPLFRFIGQLKKDLRTSQFSIQKNWDQLTDTDKANMRRAMTEIAFTIGAAVLASAIMGLKGDDDDDWVLNMMAYQANRSFTELGVMTPSPLLISESLKLIREPIAGLSVADDLINLLEVWDWFDTIESGKYKDMYKIERSMIKSIPLAKTINDWSTPEDKLIFYNNFN